MHTLRITDTSPRSDVIAALLVLNAKAKATSRQGKVGTLSEAYRVQHEAIDEQLRLMGL